MCTHRRDSACVYTSNNNNNSSIITFGFSILCSHFKIPILPFKI